MNYVFQVTTTLAPTSTPGAPSGALLQRSLPPPALTEHLEPLQEPPIATFLDVSWSQPQEPSEGEAGTGEGEGQQVAGVGGGVG